MLKRKYGGLCNWITTFKLRDNFPKVTKSFVPFDTSHFSIIMSIRKEELISKIPC